MKRKILFCILGSICAMPMLLTAQLNPVAIEKYGPVMEIAETRSYFEGLNAYFTPMLDQSKQTILIKSKINPKEFATLVIDIGKNSGNLVGIEPYRFVILDINTKKFEQVKISDSKNPGSGEIAYSLGRIQTAVYGKDDKLYVFSNGGKDARLNKSVTYMVEFDQKTYEAVAYALPDEIKNGVSQVAVNPVTGLIYGGTGDGTQLFYYDPAVRGQFVYTMEEVETNQNYVAQVEGYVDPLTNQHWIYGLLKKKELPFAYNSVYAVDITDPGKPIKYLVYNTTQQDFDLKYMTDPSSGHEHVYLKVNSRTAGTFYTKPEPIDANTNPVIYPCYDILPDNTNLSTYQCDYPFFFDPNICPNNPAWNPAVSQATEVQEMYRKNFSLGHTPTIQPIRGCDHKLFNGPVTNFPWQMPSTGITYFNPNSAVSNFYFRLDGANSILDQPGSAPPASPYYDPSTGGNPNPAFWIDIPFDPKVDPNSFNHSYYRHISQTLWDNIAMEFTVDNNIIPAPQPLSDLFRFFDAPLESLAMTDNDPTLALGSPVIVKGSYYFGMSLLKPDPSKAIGYSHEYLTSTVGEAHNVLPVTNYFNSTLNGRDFSYNLTTHIMGSYPRGQIDVYDFTRPYDKPQTLCRLEQIINNGVADQYGPYRTIGTRVYSLDNFSASSGNITTFKIAGVGTSGRTDITSKMTIGFYTFELYNNPANPPKKALPGKYSVMDRFSRDCKAFDTYVPQCVTNEAISSGCVRQNGDLRNINAYYNLGLGTSTSKNQGCNINNQSAMNLLIAAKDYDAFEDAIFLIDPINEVMLQKFDNKHTFYTAIHGSPYDLRKSGKTILNMQTIGNSTREIAEGMYIATYGPILFLFKLDKETSEIHVIDEYDFENREIRAIHVLTGPDREGSAVFTVFVSSGDNDPSTKDGEVFSIDITRYINGYRFDPRYLVKYDWKTEPAVITDFSHITKDRTKTVDVVMVGEENVYLLRNVYNNTNYMSQQFNRLANTSAINSSIDSSAIDINIYPNPFKNNIMVNNLNYGRYNFSMIDFSGKKVFTQDIKVPSKNTNYLMKTPEYLSKGIYTVILTNDKSATVKKIIKN